MSIFFRWVVQPVFRLFLYFAPRCTYQVFGPSLGTLKSGHQKTKPTSQRKTQDDKKSLLQLKERSLPSSLVYLSLGVPFRELDTNKHHSPPDPKHVYFCYVFFLLYIEIARSNSYVSSIISIYYIIYRHDIIIIDTH